METTVLSLAKSVLNGAVAKATSVITEEVALQLGVRRDVAFINDEFEMMQTFLLAADEERGEKKVVRTWVKQVRDLGYDVEDCLQDFSLHLEKPSWWRFPCTMRKRRSIANEIIDLRARVEDVSHRNLRYRLIEDPNSKPTTAADRYLSSTAAVFGIDGARRAAKLENDKVDLVDLITKDDKDLRVITVWGTSNDLGKMSTIRKAYEDPKVTKKFRCRAWVKLVNPFDPDEFLRSLVRQFYGNSDLIGTPKQGRTMGVHISKSMAAECDMENEFDRHVNENQYMIVIEDLSTISEWDWIKLYLPNTNKGSRILVSTQQIELASLCVGQPNQVSELKQFSSDQSLYIFFHKEGNDPTETSLDTQRGLNVAAHETITELISQDRKTREVISIWGSDITQRTALVRSIYENQELDGKFQRCAWITVQHPIDHAILLKSLILELDGENLEAEADKLVEELASLLKGQMYLIVLDNISTSIEWDSIVSYFPTEGCRSRIIVTTADGSVAKHCSEKHENTHELQVQEDDIEADSNKKKEFKAIGLHSSFTESDLESNSILESAKDNGATMEEPELIGREEEKSRIVEMLLRPDGGNQYCVTSVWGMGGVGKTTLVESIYHCPKIIEEFPRRLWATLLQPFNPDEFKSGLALQLQYRKIPNIIASVTRGSIQSYSIEETEQLLGNVTEKLLIVVDGISSEGEWHMVKTCLPENMANGSRIIVTTREASVAADCSVPRGNHIDLQGLKYADAFKLFKTKISKLAEDFESDPEMMEQAERIIIKCGHLPLAIVTIGGFLASRPASTMEWRKLNEHIGVELEINSSLERINKMVISSYNGLPFHLKACFLYLSIFPEGHNLRRRRLVRRWIAEGYSSKMLSLAAEEVGEKHFRDLLNRSMIQTSKETASNGEKVNLYQVNNLMRAISISKTTEEKLVCTLDDSNTNPNSRDKIRHLVVSSRCSRDKNNALVRMMDLSRIRSLTVFGEWRKHLVSSKMRLLRVLDLEDTTGLRDKDLIPIGKLRHLKFLSLRGSQGIFHLPRSFSKLLNLETLDIRGTLVTTLPGAIVKLQKLSYLRAGYIPSDEGDQSINFAEFLVTILELLSQLCGSYRTKRSVDKEQMGVLNNFGPTIGFIRSVLLKGLDPHGVKVPKRIGKMKILHTLGVVNVARGKTVIKELKTLTKLRKLGVTGINKKNGEDFCSAVQALSHLESLSVRSEGKTGLEGCLDNLSSPPKNLQSVKLYGHIAKLPTWINPEKLRNLSKLSLRSTHLEQDGALRDLEKLPKLAILCLWRDSFKKCEGATGEEDPLSLKFGPRTFPQLNRLQIADLDQLQWVVFENTAMAELEILQVDKCARLDEGGFSGTEFLPKLKEVRVRGKYKDAFKKTLQEQVTKTTLIITRK